MAWLRIPRSLRTYLIVGIIIAIGILTFSTSKMIRVDASDAGSSFPFMVISNNNDDGRITASALEHHHSELSDASSTSFTNSNNEDNVDIHTTVANLSHNMSTAPSVRKQKQETSSDTIVISPLSNSPSTSSSEFKQQQHDRNNYDSKTSSTPISTFEGNQLLENRTSYISSATLIDKQVTPSLFYPHLPSNRSHRGLNSLKVDYTDVGRRNFIRDMMKHAWHGYKSAAWGYNEVRPVTRMPHTDSIFGGEKMGASIVDGIDTLYIMGLKDEYNAAREWIANELDFDRYDVSLSVFETNIRYVGGLLSMYALTKDQLYINKAVQIADKLLPAFDTPSGIPYSNVNLKTGYAHNHDWAFGAAILSEFGSIHLEFIYLSKVTGDPKYEEKAMKIRQAIRKAVPRSDGLYNNYMSTETGQWLTRPTHISMGALGDSFYEYLIKAYVQSDGKDVEALQMYTEAMKAFEEKLKFTSAQSKLTYFAELKDTYINHKMDSLACFSGGMLALGATKSNEPFRSHHFNLAGEIANTCRESCIRTKSHLGPESFVFSNRADATAFNQGEKYYILRPEILETYFYMWRYTHDTKYRAWAWDFAEALERYCKTDGGYSGLRNVYQPVIKDDVQQSFFLAEVLKYLYLTFSDDDVISLDEYVFNTEAHPLPILREN